MANESIFTFVLEEKQVFEEVYTKALELEKLIVNELYDSVLNKSRVIIERLVRIIIVDIEEDKSLSKKYYKKSKSHTNFSQILYKCRDKKYLSNFNKIKSFIQKYGNAGSHDNDEIFTIDDVKYAHKVVFDFTEECAKKYNKRIKVPEYTFDLSYIDNKNFTKEEKNDIIDDAKIYEVSEEDIIKKAENTYLSKEEFETIIKPLISNVEEVDKKLLGIDYVTNDNLEDILTNFDKSIKNNVLEEVEKYNIENTKKIKEEIEEIKSRQKQEDMYLSKEEFIDIVLPIATKVQEIDVKAILDGTDYITDDNLSYILTKFDESIRNDILDEVNKHNSEIKKEIDEIKSNQITLEQINELIRENNNEILSLIKTMTGDIIKDQLTALIVEIQSVPTIEGGDVIDNPKYEIVESEDVFEVKEIEKIIGMPDKCPECNSILKKGAIHCHECGYDLSDIINRRCPDCGKRVSIGSDICTNCGYSFLTKKCVKCGFENKIDFKFCTNCGNELGD